MLTTRNLQDYGRSTGPVLAPLKRGNVGPGVFEGDLVHGLDFGRE